jgi:DNA repair exonuclease SbcCD nuclease subunit
VYGLSYYSREIREPLYESAFAGGIQEYEILLAHGGDEKHCPFRVKKLEESGFDYIALGHIHSPQNFKNGKMRSKDGLAGLKKV